MDPRTRRQLRNLRGTLEQRIAIGRDDDLLRNAKRYCRQNGVQATDEDILIIVDTARARRVERRLQQLQGQIDTHHPRPDPPTDPRTEPAGNGR